MLYVVTTVTPSGYVSSGIMTPAEKKAYRGEFVEAIQTTEEEAQAILDRISA